MGLPHKISTLLYVFDPSDRVLLMERLREPNRGLWSPPGGKLHSDAGESPYDCAVREAQEELGLTLSPTDLHLTGLVSEHAYSGREHWLMFLFEVGTRVPQAPAPCPEGRFEFFRRDQLDGLKLPATDKAFIWPLLWTHRGGFFAVHCRCKSESEFDWTVEETRGVQRA